MQANEYNSWRNTLINILRKHGKTTSSVSNWTGTTVEPGESTTSKQIDDIKNDIINSTRALCHVPAISSLDVGDYSVGKPTLLETKTKIESKLAEMNAVCHHYSDNTHDGDLSNYSEDGDWTYYGPDRTENFTENEVVAYIPEST